MGAIFAMEILWAFAIIYHIGGVFLSEHPWIPEVEEQISI